MAIKRKPAPSRMKPAKSKKKGTGATPAKKAPAKAAARKPTPPPAKVAAPKPPAKPVKAVAAKAPPAPVVKGGKGAKPAPTKLKVVQANPPVVRPIGALPPEAVARAIRTVPTPSTPRPARAAVAAGRPSPVAEAEAAVLSEKDIKEFEQRLMAERQKILKEMGHLENTVLKVNQRESAGDLSGYSFHMADVGTDAMEREKAFMFASNEGHLLQEIDHALRKLYRGEYGPCENCGRPISRARLEAMPYARLCLTCKEEEERSNRGPQ